MLVGDPGAITALCWHNSSTYQLSSTPRKAGTPFAGQATVRLQAATCGPQLVEGSLCLPQSCGVHRKAAPSWYFSTPPP